MNAKSVSELLKDLEKKSPTALVPSMIFDDLTQEGLKGIWNELSLHEKELFIQFIDLKQEEAKTNHVEYAYYFWGRIRNRLLTKQTPIGEEHE